MGTKTGARPAAELAPTGLFSACKSINCRNRCCQTVTLTAEALDYLEELDRRQGRAPMERRRPGYRRAA